MKTVILAGGYGTRISEATSNKPKPMVRIGSWPILVHIMEIYSAAGHFDFLIACGYRGDVIKEYFANFRYYNGDSFFDLGDGGFQSLNSEMPNWKVGCVDTGENSMTGGRIKRLSKYIGQERFMVTYGDGLANIDINELIAFHESEGRLATVTAVRPPARFGSLELAGTSVASFDEKTANAESWINGGFFVFEPEIFDLIKGDDIKLEGEPLTQLAKQGQLTAYRHRGFWQPMDTLREYTYLQELWASGNHLWQMP